MTPQSSPIPTVREALESADQLWDEYLDDLDGGTASAQGAVAFAFDRLVPSHPVVSEEVPYGIIDPKYAAFYTVARLTAWSYGYAVALHGSFTRDLDLIAIPWTDAAVTPEKLIKQIQHRSGLKAMKEAASVKEHGRLVWTLTFPEFDCPRFVDFSIIPPLVTADNILPGTDDMEKREAWLRDKAADMGYALSSSALPAGQGEPVADPGASGRALELADQIDAAFEAHIYASASNQRSATEKLNEVLRDNTPAIIAYLRLYAQPPRPDREAIARLLSVKLFCGAAYDDLTEMERETFLEAADAISLGGGK